MPTKKTIRTRFAPSPTGYLHIGGLRTALYAYLYAKKNGGTFILRIEDTDQERYVEGAVDMICRTLKEAGLNYDEGPDVGGKYGPYVQSERKAEYLKYAKDLVKKGGAYYCFCDSDRLDKMRKDGATKYDKQCLSLSVAEVTKRIKNGEPYVIRQNIPTEGETRYTDLLFGEIVVDCKELEDGVLIKSDGMPTYNFANVIDDYLMGINCVIRGTEYLSSTPKYNLMYDGLGWERPEYIHLQPIMRDAQNKLSKRHGDACFEDFIAKGYLKDAIVNYIALLGWSPKDNREKMTMQEMLDIFGVDGLSKSNSIFDIAKMRWLNALYIKELSADNFYKLMKPHYAKLKYLKGYDLKYLSTLIQGRIELPSEVDSLVGFINEWQDFDKELFVNQKQKTDRELATKILPDILKVVKASTMDTLYENLSALAGKLEIKVGAIFWIFRIAITGSLVTPGGATEMAKLLGKERVVERLTMLNAQFSVLN
ncbi:MAG: glutamate--tRNA ligase [Firmicutes bacterium]|nr:glutamate--tRNA ligase [Bacillota bacterium]